MNTTISAGDKVRIKSNYANLPVLNDFRDKDLTVTFVTDTGLSFAECEKHAGDTSGAFFLFRFEKVADGPKASKKTSNKKSLVPKSVILPKPARGKNGRFISPKNKVKPVMLRQGSLYMTKRKRTTEVARLRRVIGDTLAMERHGSFFYAKRANVTLASATQVKTYLKEEKVAA